MDIASVVAAFEQAGKRTHVVGDQKHGVLVALDMEARLYTYVNGEVVNRVNPLAIAGHSTSASYLNPGGDGLWPAPEGTRLGYQYATGRWRVPSGIRFARYQVVESGDDEVTVEAEVDLVNNEGLGIPTLFRRHVRREDRPDALTVHVRESITYSGSRSLPAGTFLLAPWTLCQFDCGPGCYVIFPGNDRTVLWDLYEETIAASCVWDEHHCTIPTDGTRRFQVGLGEQVPWITFHDPSKGLVVRREAGVVHADQRYIDIRDAGPTSEPDRRGVRYSVYADPDGFMEIEAVGGCPADLQPGTELHVSVSTTYHY